MRRRITSALLAAAAAGATVTTLGFTAAGAANTAPLASAAAHPINRPSGGAPIYTDANCPRVIPPTSPPSGPADSAITANATITSASCARSGYQASNRDFRFAQAVIAVPTADGSLATSPDLYVGLYSSPTEFARAGIEPCTINFNCPNGWQGFYEVMQQGTPTISVTVPFTGVVAGDGVFFSIYFNSVGNAVRFVVTLPDGTTAGQTAAMNGPVYTTAVALADWSLTTTSPAPAVPLANSRVTQFFQGRFTTLSGQQGTFNGPWTLNPVEVTTNGLAPPSGTLISAPSYLWTDANSFKGLPSDAFGVWLYNP
jgi:hypothetical protein